MSDTSELTRLLATMNPLLSDSEMVFCCLPDVGLKATLSLSPVGFFAEAEGLSLIIARPVAERNGIPFDTVFRAITLTVQSSLEAVGLTAAVSGRLALHGISANVVAAYHHDHIFVPAADADRALELLMALQIEAAGMRDGP